MRRDIGTSVQIVKDATYDYDHEVRNKHQLMCGKIKKKYTVRKKTRKDTQMKFNKIMAVTVFVYGSE